MSILYKGLVKRNIFPRYLNTVQKRLIESGVEEIKIPVPWGHIAGKWWGNKNLAPVIAIHGWQDNANSFDKLIPLLNLPSVLAIDLPGHGQSSHLPLGKVYDFGEYLITLHRLKKINKWPTMAFICHSFGGALGHAYSSLFPDEVRFLIDIEGGSTLMTLIRLELSETLSKGIDSFLKIEEQKAKTVLPVYKLSKMIKTSVEGSFGCIPTPEIAMILLKRGIYLADDSVGSKEKLTPTISLESFHKYELSKAETLAPEDKKRFKEVYSSLMENWTIVKEKMKNFQLDEKEDKYYVYSRDPSLKVEVFQSWNEEYLLESSKNIKCPVLLIKGTNGFLNGSVRNLYNESLNILKQSSKHVENHEVCGSHYVHLTDPEALEPIINKFLETCASLSPTKAAI